MTTAATGPPRSIHIGPGVGNTFAFDQVDEPGAYVCNWSGHLLRLPEDAVAAGRSPLLEIIAQDELQVTKISENPFVQVTKARMIASDLDLAVKF